MSSLLRRQLEASLAHEKIQIGFRQVQDPYEPDKDIIAAYNVNSDVVLNLFRRGKIDDAQLLAGRYFLSLVEKAEGSSFLVPNMAREPVDCSVHSFSVPDFRLDAQGQLIRVARFLGGRDFRMARKYLTGDASAYPEPETQREKDYHSRRLRDILEDLAGYWGFAQ